MSDGQTIGKGYWSWLWRNRNKLTMVSVAPGEKRVGYWRWMLARWFPVRRRGMVMRRVTRF